MVSVASRVEKIPPQFPTEPGPGVCSTSTSGLDPRLACRTVCDVHMLHVCRVPADVTWCDATPRWTQQNKQQTQIAVLGVMMMMMIRDSERKHEPVHNINPSQPGGGGAEMELPAVLPTQLKFANV